MACVVRKMFQEWNALPITHIKHLSTEYCFEYLTLWDHQHMGCTPHPVKFVLPLSPSKLLSNLRTLQRICTPSIPWSSPFHSPYEFDVIPIHWIWKSPYKCTLILLKTLLMTIDTSYSVSYSCNDKDHWIGSFPKEPAKIHSFYKSNQFYTRTHPVIPVSSI